MTVESCSCSLFQIPAYAMLILQYIPGAGKYASKYSTPHIIVPDTNTTPAFSALRAYVLSRRKTLGVLVFALSLAPVGANLVSATMILEP